jgi:hypothetical protein
LVARNGGAAQWRNPSEVHVMTPERKAEIDAAVEEILGPKPLPKPKVVTRDDLGTVRDADVHVSRVDPNTSGDNRVIEVRRPDYVTINIPEWERQQAEKLEERRERRRLDPCRLGLYGPIDDDE